MFLDFKVNILDFCCCWEMFYSHTLHSCFPLYPDCWLQFKTVLSNVKATSHMWKWSGVKVAQSCPTLCDPMDCTVHGILQVRILEWVAFPFSKGSFQPRDWTQVSCIAGRFFTSWTTREAQEYWLEWVAYRFSSESSQPRNRTGISCIAGRFFTN